jgi:hypothetical protein
MAFLRIEFGSRPDTAHCSIRKDRRRRLAFEDLEQRVVSTAPVLISVTPVSPTEIDVKWSGVPGYTGGDYTLWAASDGAFHRVTVPDQPRQQ